MRKTRTTITIESEQLEKAKVLSKKTLGTENVSGFIGYLIEEFYKQSKSK